jgi:hypothetical protein
MKKRNIISFLTGTALLFSMPACTNLDETVYDNVPADSFGYTDSEISVLVGTVYKTLKNYPADGNFIALDVMSGSDAVTPTRKVATGMMVVSIVRSTCTHGLRRLL